jgi:hypothetical protein
MINNTVNNVLKKMRASVEKNWLNEKASKKNSIK